MDFTTTENKFSVNKIAYESCDEQQISCEINLPDYCSDAAKILKPTLRPEITSKLIRGDRIVIEGVVWINIIYCDKEGMIKSYETQTSFTKNFDIGFDADDGMLRVTICRENITVHPMSPRKITVNGSFKIGIILSKKCEITMVGDASGGGIELNKSEFIAESFIGSGEKFAPLEETLDIEQSKPPLATIIDKQASVKITETKIIPGKLIVKGEVTLRVLYSADYNSLNLEELECKYPVSQIVDIDGLGENCVINAEMTIASLRVTEQDMSGECHKIAVNISVSTFAEAGMPVSVPLIIDAYSTDFPVNSESDNIIFRMQGDKVNDSAIFKKSIEMPADDIHSVQSLSCNCEVNSNTRDKDMIVISGIIKTCIIATDQNDRPVFCEKAIDFEYRTKADNSGDNTVCRAEVGINSATYTLKGGNSVEVRCELYIDGVIVTEYEKTVITMLSVDAEKPIDKSNFCGMTLYYAEAGEKIWDIAKRYNTGCDCIMTDNSLSGDEITSPRMLLISSR